MLGITEKYNQFKESTYFAGGKFVICATCVCLAATFAAGCLGAVIGSPLLTFPLAMLISHPVIWIIMGVVLTTAYKLAKNYINGNGKGASKGEKSESMDSGVDTISRKTDGSDDTERRSSSTSLDSGLGGKEFHENLDTLVHQTNRENYTYWLQQHDIAHIARAVYNYSESSDGHIFFCIPGNLESLNERLREYKNKAEQENLRIFTSVINLGGNHWVTLVIAYNPDSKKFRAYYCDSFSADLPSPGSQRKKIELANEIKDELFAPLTNQASELNAQGKKEMGQDVRKTAQTCRDKKNELINVPINTDNIVSALEAVLEIENCNIRSSGAKQQSDGHNCGIFALENAHKITQMLNEGKSFDEIDKELSEYKFDLNGKRREFTKALMEDEGWKEHLKNGLLCDLPPGTDTSLTSRVQNTAQVAI
ncbi:MULTISPECIES: hypothetical protein [unclassified Wolbachia]|uniref:hypothetical protein n=1 Tax=unclassified Wolbachia TaxID=2640676 RepID=UPI00222F55B2|nr:hypothetical protein [Wolbachia endosymbiont (group A) of Apoderus coryli]